MLRRTATTIMALALLGLAQPEDRSPERFENAIRTFEARAGERPANPVLFIGSSSIRDWKSLAADFAGIPVVNHGFGGSEISDSLHFFDRAITPVRPRAIVLYAGENDVWHGKTPEVVHRDFTTFVHRVESALPGTPIGFIALKPSPKRLRKWARYQKANGMIHAECLRHPRLEFFDIAHDLLDENGAVRGDLFIADDLHLNRDGYSRWTARIRPWLDRVAGAPGGK